jgi:phosphoglycerol geranylgeranyltransferase
MQGKIYSTIVNNKASGKKMLAVLIDPDKADATKCVSIREKSIAAGVDYFFVGGSILMGNNFEKCITLLKSSPIPVLLFPGNIMQISDEADGLLFLSLISGRNPEMLIGRHVLSAPVLKRSALEIIPTGYMLIDSGSPTSVSYMSNTVPIPHMKDDIAVSTAIAGELLGLKLIYMDGGSGARFPVSSKMISSVSQNISVPLIIGGGIKTADKAIENCHAGADIIVIGNAIEDNPDIIFEMATAMHAYQTI